MYEPRSEADLVRLIEAYPLAWVVSMGSAAFAATPLPLLAETDASGHITSLFGHFARSNPQVEALRASPHAAILFSGPNGYVSPELVSQPRWAPTWNYAIAHFEVDVVFVPEENDQALAQLVTRMEAGRKQPWTVAQMGDRYAQLAQHIVAFRAHVRSARGRFKLGQDERPATLDELLQGLPDAALVSWMREFNPPAPHTGD